MALVAVRRGRHTAREEAEYGRERYERRLVSVLQHVWHHIRESRWARRPHSVTATLHAQWRRTASAALRPVRRQGVSERAARARRTAGPGRERRSHRCGL